jgi:hypothetical protein
MIDWIKDADIRRRAQIGLNKGEAHHALKRAVNKRPLTGSQNWFHNIDYANRGSQFPRSRAFVSCFRRPHNAGGSAAD